MVRVKRRYILANIKYQGGSPSQEAFLKELRDKIRQMYGDFGLACLNRGFSIKKYDQKDGYIIISLRKGVHEIVMSVLPMITQVDRVQCCPILLHLSGTIRGCLKHLKQNYLMNLRAAIGEKLAAQKDSCESDSI